MSPAARSTAYTGKRWIMMKPGWRCKDYPRVCGEKRSREAANFRLWGSPPRVRGKGPGVALLHDGKGITPAYAGKSSRRRCCRAGLGDHPRMCGEKKRHVIQLNRTWGSSPRVRGKERLPHMAAQSGGINPACAGKSRCPPELRSDAWDHPRVCGEK